MINNERWNDSKIVSFVKFSSKDSTYYHRTLMRVADAHTNYEHCSVT